MFPLKNLVHPDREVRSKYNSIERISFSGGHVVYYGQAEELATLDPASAQTTEKNVPQGKFLGSSFGKTVKSKRRIRMPDIEETIPTSPSDVLDLLRGLPPYCVKDPQYGLGFKRPYRAVVHAIEDLTAAKEIEISQHDPTLFDETSTTFVISANDMLALTSAINRVNRTTRAAANTVNDTSTYNQLADILGLPRRQMTYGRTPLRKALTAVGNDERPLSSAERVELLETLTKNVGTILEGEPARMDGLESGIARARTRNLLENLNKMMKGGCNERTWQQFLQDNPFVLSLLFGRPIVRIADQASVGGRKISGQGDKIADFLVKNGLTNNAALVEIKTPKAKLLNQTPYRKDVYTPAGELVGAINQVLDQKNKFEQDIAKIRDRDRTLDVEAYHVQAYVLAGRTPPDRDRVRSFELFRHNLKDVVVMTFDELLRKVEDLCEFLEGGNGMKDDDIPF